MSEPVEVSRNERQSGISSTGKKCGVCGGEIICRTSVIDVFMSDGNFVTIDGQRSIECEGCGLLYSAIFVLGIF